jgi:hypothetical protein
MARLARLKSTEGDIDMDRSSIDWSVIAERLTTIDSIPESTWPLLVHGFFAIRDALPPNSTSINIFNLWIRNQARCPTDTVLSQWYHDTWIKNDHTRKVVSEVMKTWVDGLLYTMDDNTVPEDGKEQLDEEDMDVEAA